MSGRTIIAHTHPSMSSISKKTLAEAGVKKDSTIHFHHTGLIGGAKDRVHVFPSLQEYRKRNMREQVEVALYYYHQARPDKFMPVFVHNDQPIVQDSQHGIRLALYRKIEEKILTTKEKQGNAPSNIERRKTTYQSKMQQLEKAMPEYDRLYYKCQQLAMECNIWKRVVQEDADFLLRKEEEEEVCLCALICCKICF